MYIRTFLSTPYGQSMIKTTLICILVLLFISSAPAEFSAAASFSSGAVPKFQLDLMPHITVTSPADSGEGSLRWAIANLASGGTIDFALTYPTTILLTSGTLVIENSMTIVGPGVHELAISGNHDGRVFDILPGATVSIYSLTIADGVVHRPTIDDPAEGGGGIRNAGTLTVEDCVIKNNEADYGGGIHNSGTLTVAGANIIENHAADLNGGGDGGGIYTAGDALVQNTAILWNHAYGGGGIINWGTGVLTISTCSISENNASNGGGLENGSQGWVTIQNSSTIASNTAVYIGGGIVNYPNGSILMQDSFITGNQADYGGGIQNQGDMDIWRTTLDGNIAGRDGSGDGGGIYTDGDLYVNESTFTNNEAVGGGGIHNWIGVAEIRYTSFTNNHALLNGGAIENGNSGEFQLSYSTIANNTAVGDGGGIFNLENGVFVLATTTIANNAAAYGGGINNDHARFILNTTSIIGNAVNGNCDESKGGGIFNKDGEFSITHGSIKNNRAACGGGVFNLGDQSNLSINQSTIAENTVTVFGGGIASTGAGMGTAQITLSNSAVYSNTSDLVSAGINNSGSNMTLTNTSIHHNHALGGGGGGITNGSGLAIFDSAIYNNTAWEGAGIFTGGMVTMYHTSIEHNTSRFNGGGVYNSDGFVFIGNHSEISQNQAVLGGGIFNFETGQLTLENSSVVENIAIAEIDHSVGMGGGIYNINGNLSLSGCTIQNNHAGERNFDLSTDGDGGGVYTSGGVLTVANCAITGNTALGVDKGRGGGIFAENTLATLTNSVVNGNIASSSNMGYGGGLYAEGGDMTVSDCLISSNEASGWHLYGGGGIYLSGAMVTLNRSAVSNNNVSGSYATDKSGGGGIYNNGGSLSATNCTISSNGANQSGTSGGGISTLDSSTTLTHCTVSNNYAYNTGGIYGNATLNHTIIAYNTSTSVPHRNNCSGPITSQGYNLENENTCGLSNIGDLPNTDPMLGPLQDNGGLTPTRALLWASPAIDAIPVGTCSETSDQRSQPRPEGVACDIGAYEANQTLIAIDILPRDNSNIIDLSSHKKIRVAILSTPGWYAPTQIDRNWLHFGHNGFENSLYLKPVVGTPACSMADVNDDGLPDLVCVFILQSTNLHIGDPIGILRAKDMSGNWLVGTDFVIVVP